jgi:hypothetical protein
MMLTVIGFLALLGLLITISLIIYARWNYGVLEATGVPVIKPTFFLGSVPDLHLQVQTEQDIKRFRHFGLSWGVRKINTITHD